MKSGDWVGMFSGANEEHKVVPRCVAMAYYPDGTPKRSVGVFYSDINMVWSKGMDESQFGSLQDRDYYKATETTALTDKQFIGEV